MKECNVNELNERMRDTNSVLVDVREPAEYAGGRVSGSVLIPLGSIEQRAAEIDKDKEVYVICRTGNRSAKAQAKLSRLGFGNVTNVAGGFQAWQKNGLAFDKDDKAPWDIERQVRFVAGLLVLTGFVLSVFVHPYLIGISAFIGAGLVFSSVTNTCTMGLILMKMPWNRIKTVQGQTAESQ